MSKAVATVTYTQGQVWAKSPDGSLRPLQAGSLVNADEVIVTAEGASVELDFGDGIPVAIAGNQ
jgi:large repetitive protein